MSNPSPDPYTNPPKGTLSLVITHTDNMGNTVEVRAKDSDPTLLLTTTYGLNSTRHGIEIHPDTLMRIWVHSVTLSRGAIPAGPLNINMQG
jgi:hypothetical protein